MSHLDPFRFAFRVEKLGGRSLTLDVKFSNHCYTEEYDEGQHNPAHIVMDRGRRRAFAPERHALSLLLPSIIQDLPAGSVHITRQVRNYVYVARIDVGQVDYAVFFHLKRGRDACDLAMMVESAYPVAAPPDLLRGTTKISFAVLCAKTFRQERIVSHIRR